MKRLFLLLLASAAATACVDSDPVSVGSAPQFRPQAAAVFTGNIRIGVVQGTSSLLIGSAGDYTIVAKNSGATLMSGSNGTVTVTATAGVTRWYVQVVCAFTPAALQVEINRAVQYGHPYVTEFNSVANCTRLLLGNFLLSDPFSVRTAYLNLVKSQGFSQQSFGTTRTIGGTTYKVTRGSTVAQTDQPVVLTSSTGLVKIGTSSSIRTYRGKAEAILNSSGTLAGVNELPLDEYLYGVVPRELGPIAYPEVEAQKAQAIAARTYALAGIGKRAVDGYDLRATTDDQVYGGYQDEHPVSTAAVEGTRGVVLTYNGNLISALYSSASGGHTADNEEAYNASPAAYLRGVPDAERGEAFEHVPDISVFRSHANAMSLRNVKEGDFESDWSRYHRWTFEWDMDQISSVVSDFALQPVGKVLAINVTDRGPSGRATRIEYVTEAGTFVDTRDHIRTSLKYINTTGAKVSLPSTLFFIEPVTDPKTKELTGYEVFGGGFGHGVGMAQTGAVGMAQKGHSYDEILKHYYRDVELTVAY